MEDNNSYHHVLLFPAPAMGHINPFLHLAKLLSNAGLKVTLLNTEYNHRLIEDLRRAAAADFPSLRFDSISDGLPIDEPRSILLGKPDFCTCTLIPTLFKDLLLSYNDDISGGRSPVTCVITDAIVRFPITVADELGIPVFSFSNFGARFLFLYFYFPQLLDDGQLPPSDGNTNKELQGIPVGQGLLRCKDVPFDMSILDKDAIMRFVNDVITSSRTSGLIINTFDELDAPFLTHLSTIYKKVYSLGPMHSFFKDIHRAAGKEDHSCLAWLDSQSLRSVVFVCFGTIMKITSSHLIELWNGLINSEKPFLLTLRSDIFESDEDKQVVKQILETKSNGKWLVESWVPQEEVLAHEAIGGFFTHAGWNSTLEGIASGVPMVCWPQFGDQMINSLSISKVWKIGVEIEDLNDRSTVEKMVRSIMEHGNENMFRKRVGDLAKRVKDLVSKDGTSYRNLMNLVEDIKESKRN